MYTKLYAPFQVSMLGPSPDWIVGVSGLELCLPNCTWVENKELFLYPWDAGVDSGISYESPDSPSEPKMPITRYKNIPMGNIHRYYLADINIYLPECSTQIHDLKRCFFAIAARCVVL